MRQDNSRRVVKLVKQEKTFKQAIADEKKQQDKVNNQRSTSNRPYTPNRKSPTASNNTTATKPKTLIAQIQRYLSHAKSAKERIYEGLQFVKLMDNFHQQQRCLQHNHVITLYCLNDKKLLCVYCIYGQNKHRSHKLLPPLQHIQHIAQDVTQLQNSFNSFLYSLEEIITQARRSTDMFKEIMKGYLGRLEKEYIRRKLVLEQMYEKQKGYIVRTCEEIIAKSESIYGQFEDIKFNIWQCQARYNLDKRVKVPNVTIDTQTLPDANRTPTKTISKSPSKLRTKQPIQQKNQPQKHQLSTDSEKDMRQVMCKHVILSHIVEEMKLIDPLRIDEKMAEKKMFNKLELRMLYHQNQQMQNSSQVGSRRTNSTIK